MTNKTNLLAFAPNAVDVIRSHFISTLRDSEKDFLRIMKKEVLQTVHGDGPGKPDWRQSIQNKLRVVEETFTDEYLEGKVGLPDNVIYTDFVKAMLIAYGAGSAGLTGVCIQAGPQGRDVWDDDLSGKKPSEVSEQYMLPPYFNQSGNEFVANAVKIMKSRFTLYLDQALANLSLDSLITVSAR